MVFWGKKLSWLWYFGAKYDLGFGILGQKIYPGYGILGQKVVLLRVNLVPQ